MIVDFIQVATENDVTRADPFVRARSRLCRGSRGRLGKQRDQIIHLGQRCLEQFGFPHCTDIGRWKFEQAHVGHALGLAHEPGRR